MKVYKVKGKITMSGGAVANATVSFSPKAKQPVATGRTASDGTYTLTTYDTGDGAAEGEYVVLVTKPNVTAAPSTPASAHDAYIARGGPPSHDAQTSEGTQASSALPEKYSRVNESDLKATVKSSGENVLDFELQP